MDNISIFQNEAFGILGPLITLYVILMAWTLVSYIIIGISLFGIGKRMGIKAYGLA